jgi:hypothetical protein
MNPIIQNEKNKRGTNLLHHIIEPLIRSFTFKKHI